MTCLSLSPEGTPVFKKALIQFCQHNFVQIHQHCFQTNSQQKERKGEEECLENVIHISDHATKDSEMRRHPSFVCYTVFIIVTLTKKSASTSGKNRLK
jgi:hypothetical protein